MTDKEILYNLESKYPKVLKEIHDIEMTSDKNRRLRWRELQKLKVWMEREIIRIKFKLETKNNESLREII